MLLNIEKKVMIMIKIDIISGFLGAGKTTLIKKIFETVLTNEKVKFNVYYDHYNYIFSNRIWFI